MQRLPVVIVENLQLPAAYATQATTPANVLERTISAFTLNNTTTTARTVSISIVPAAGAQGAANEYVTTLTVPIAGSAPTIVSSLIGHHMAAGSTLQMKCDAASAVTARVSGYDTTL